MIVDENWIYNGENLRELYIIYIVLMILSAVANMTLLVMGVLKWMRDRDHPARSKCFREFSFLYLVSCDLLQSLFGCAFRGPDLLHGTHSELACKIKCYLSLLTTDPFLLAILPITLDRFVATVFPYRRKSVLHKRILLAPIVFSWCYALLDLLLIKLLYEPHLISQPIITYNSTWGLCGLAAWKTETVREHVRTTVTMILPLLFNLVTYTVIVCKIRQRRVKVRHKIVTLKSVLICFFFTLSWIPSFIALDLLRCRHQTVVRVSQLCLYLNCLMDPLLYSLPTNTLARFLTKLDLMCDNPPSAPCTGDQPRREPKIKKVSGPKTTEKTNVVCAG